MRAILIRHGATAGNLQGRYIGSRTDEPLCPEGIDTLRRITVPVADRLICSPMKRCIETAAVLYPDMIPEIEPDLRETDFGEFEGMNYEEMNGREDYQRWIDSNGELPFPNGESRSETESRVRTTFLRLAGQYSEETLAIVAHGGTLMAIMSAFARPEMPYFAYQAGNAEGFILEADGTWQKLHK